jgi:predicted ABC-type ATPase
MPDAIFLAGSNGAGKSTLASSLLDELFGPIEFINADEIADREKVEALQAGRRMLRRISHRRRAGDDFAVETTLATRSFVPLIRQLTSEGYTVHLLFLWLHSANLAMERVKARVRRGGHDIPESTVRRRYLRGIHNLHKLYIPVVDDWRVYDSSGKEPALIAFGDKMKGATLVAGSLWEELKKGSTKS